MNPREAGRVEYEEPDWPAEFDAECLRWPNLPKYLQEESAFPEIMRRWRRFHATPVEVEGQWKRRPASATEAMIALAKLRIMPPRSAWVDIPHGNIVEGYQHDDHAWLSLSGELWRITGVEDCMLFLEKMTFDDKREQKQIDLNRARWDQYCESAAAVLEAQKHQAEAHTYSHR
jgi:hypothetical protein